MRDYFLDSWDITPPASLEYGDFHVIVTHRNAALAYPTLNGNFVHPDVLSTKEFYEVFKDAYIDVDEFTGILSINLQQENGKPRGKIKFEGNVKFKGDAKVSITVPAGQEWVIRDRAFDVNFDFTVSDNEITLAN